MIAAIHQPNFFPWLGYFHKIARADVFVFLDAVAFSKGSWTNRVRMLVGGEPRWVTCPVLQKIGQPINHVRIDDHQPWRRKMIKTMETNYFKAECFCDVMDWLEPLIATPTDLLATFNIPCIIGIARRLGLKCDFVCQSEMLKTGDRENKGSKTLVQICRRLNADTYLAGDGADEYEDMSAYELAGVRMIKSGFRRQTYPQAGSRQFVPGLSVLDALFNIGLHETRTLLAGKEL